VSWPRYPDNDRVLLENDRVRVLLFTLLKGDTEVMHAHPAAVTYVLAPFKIRFTLDDGRVVVREAKAGDVFYGEALSHSPQNVGDTDARGILVEMKRALPARASEGSDVLTAITFIDGVPGREDELKAELLALTAPTRAEEGNFRYDFYQSLDRRNQFVRIEEWKDGAALEAHKQTPHLKASFEKRRQQGWTTNITLWSPVVP
jgi:quinol monooxygenase YgiN/quercetin dioxygenase-like cupin family protein